MESWIPDDVLGATFDAVMAADAAADGVEPHYRLDTSLSEYRPPATTQCTWICRGPRVHDGRIVDWVARCRRLTADPSGLCWTHKRDRDRGAR